MATLSATELQAARNAFAVTQVVNCTKTQENLAAQACEDFLTNNATAISTSINTATSPFVFTAAQKKKIFAEVARLKYLRDQ